MPQPDPLSPLFPHPSPPAIVVDGRTLPIVVVRHRRARRYLLRVTEEGRIRLTVPARASAGTGMRFARSQTSWIAREWRRLRDRAEWVEGTIVWFRGVRVALGVRDDGIHVADLRVVTSSVAPDSGARVAVRPLVHSAMRRAATAELTRRGHELAEAGGFAPARVIVRGQRTRWGSCSSRGVVSLNWRLIQMPPSVADYVIQHELVHLRHPNHSARFWRAVEAVCPDWRTGEAWLRRFGPELL